MGVTLGETREWDDRFRGSLRVTIGMSYWSLLSSACAYICDGEQSSTGRYGVRGESIGVFKRELSPDNDGDAVGNSRERVLLVLSGNCFGLL